MAKPFKLSVKVVIRDTEGRCLLLKRSRGARGNPGKWDLPGGKIEAGEDFESAVGREVAEETGLTIALDRVAITKTVFVVKLMACSPLNMSVLRGTSHESASVPQHCSTAALAIPRDIGHLFTSACQSPCNVFHV